MCVLPLDVSSCFRQLVVHNEYVSLQCVELNVEAVKLNPFWVTGSLLMKVL